MADLLAELCGGQLVLGSAAGTPTIPATLPTASFCARFSYSLSLLASRAAAFRRTPDAACATALHIRSVDAVGQLVLDGGLGEVLRAATCCWDPWQAPAQALQLGRYSALQSLKLACECCCQCVLRFKV